MVEGLGAGHLAVLLYVLIALPLVGAETLGVAGSQGRVCHADSCSPVSHPPFGAARRGKPGKYCTASRVRSLPPPHPKLGKEKHSGNMQRGTIGTGTHLKLLPVCRRCPRHGRCRPRPGLHPAAGRSRASTHVRRRRAGSAKCTNEQRKGTRQRPASHGGCGRHVRTLGRGVKKELPIVRYHETSAREAREVNPGEYLLNIV